MEDINMNTINDALIGIDKNLFKANLVKKYLFNK
jgi:hypothetical protein